MFQFVVRSADQGLQSFAFEFLTIAAALHVQLLQLTVNLVDLGL